MIIGFSGSREGMTFAQKQTIKHIIILLDKDTDEVHHGACIGADQEFDALCRLVGHKIYRHPGFPEDHPMRAHLPDYPNAILEDVIPPLDRNEVIVSKSNLILAAPRSNSRGTYHTIDYAIRTKTDTWIVNEKGLTDPHIYFD